MADAMARLWAKFLPETERRLSVLEAAVTALEAGALSPDKRDDAHAEAHKLAGSLGTFGLHRGTALAREAEALLVADQEHACLAKLAPLVGELRLLIDSRK